MISILLGTPALLLSLAVQTISALRSPEPDWGFIFYASVLSTVSYWLLLLACAAASCRWGVMYQADSPAEQSLLVFGSSAQLHVILGLFSAAGLHTSTRASASFFPLGSFGVRAPTVLQIVLQSLGASLRRSSGRG